MSQQKTCGRLVISPDEGVLRLGRRLLALASLWRADLDYAALEVTVGQTSLIKNVFLPIINKTN